MLLMGAQRPRPKQEATLSGGFACAGRQAWGHFLEGGMGETALKAGVRLPPATLAAGRPCCSTGVPGGAPPQGAGEPAGLRHPSTWAIPPLGRVCLASALEAREGQGRPQETGRVLRETAGLRKVSQRPHGRATRRHCSAPPVAAESGRTGRPLGCSDPHHRRVTRGHSLGVRGLPVEQPNPMHTLLTARDLERPQRAGHPLEHQATGLLHSPEHLRKQFLR